MLGRRGVAAEGAGRSVNFSSRGIAFRTGEVLQEGMDVELNLAWPAALDDGCPLKLVVSGKVIRSGNGIAVATVNRYEFRTRRQTPGTFARGLETRIAQICPAGGSGGRYGAAI